MMDGCVGKKKKNHPLKRNMKNLWHCLWGKLACTSKDVCKINIPDHVVEAGIGSEKFYRQPSTKQIAPDSSETLFVERI